MQQSVDSQLQHAVLNAFKAYPCLADVTLGVSVHAGIVTLFGFAANHEQRVAAQQAAHSTPGILDVANDIRVGHSERAGRTDSEIAEAVRAALQACEGVPSERVRSTVTHGWVLLEGELDSDAQREAALAAAREVLCVCGVNDGLTIAAHATGVSEAPCCCAHA